MCRGRRKECRNSEFADVPSYSELTQNGPGLISKGGDCFLPLTFRWTIQFILETATDKDQEVAEGGK